MKKLFLLLAVLSTVGLWAVPAHRQWRTVTQTDGSVIEVMTIGDEFYHYTINRAGQQVRETNGVYQVVGEAPTAEVVKARRAKAVARRQRKDIGTTPNLAPKGVVILANFSDQSMQSGHTQVTFDELCNSLNCTVNSGYPSAAQYFADQSKGAYRPQFDVYGPVTLSRALSYYGADKNNEEGNDQHAADVVVEACILANQQDTINWADYDTNNDGYIDFVYVIYAGKGQADGGSSETIWPHNWKVSNARSYGSCTYTASECKVGGKVIENYAMSSELSSNGLCGIGTLCHEFGHVMGLPDLYDTNYNTNYESCLTPNDWNIMDQGSYNADGHCPPNYDPWQKDFFGWHTPVNLGSEPQNVTLYANGTENYQAYQINASGSYVGPTTSGERYYIENRQQTGWDAPLTGHGMLVWKVNFNASKWTNNEPNNTANSPYYTVVSAYGTKIGTDGNTNNCPWNTFPGTKNVTTCTLVSGRALTDITEASNIVTCKFNNGASDTPTDTTSTGTTNNETKWYAIGWINGEDAGESAYSTFNDTYMFRDGKLTINCAMGSYIAIKDQDTNFYYSRTEATVADTVVTLEWANGWAGLQKWAIPEGTNYIIIREASPKGSITLERVNKATYDAYPFTPTDTIPDTPTDTTIITQYEVAATMTAGTSASTATVNGQAAIKCGTSVKAGDMTVTVGAGAAYLSLYIASWSNVRGVSAAIEAPEGVTVLPTTLVLAPDSGITGNTPFTLKGDEATYKHTVILKNVTAETALKISCEKRFVAWGAVYGTDSANIPIDTIPVVPTDTTQDALSISVAQALEIGASLSAGGSIPQTYSITGYVSEAESYNEAYQNQNFWITDTKGSTANTNDQGALYIYRGKVSSAVKVGNKISITTAIRKYQETIETESNAPVTILDSDTIPDTPKDTIPTATILATMYDVTNNMVLCLQFVDDAKVCGDVYFVGENNNWGKGTGTETSFDNCLKFQQVPGFEGWYVVEVPFTGSFEGKPMHVSEDKAWTWDYQSGDVNAWSYVSGKRLQLTAGYSEECNVAYASAGAYIYRLKYWKKHNNPCEAQITRDYTIRLYAPDACPEMKPAIIGDFNNWSVNMPMREGEDASGRTVYTYTLTDVVGHAFKIREVNDTAWTNEMLYYWAEEDYWVAFPNIELGTTETIELDWSDNDNYRFAQCVPGSTIDDPVYTIVLSDPVCEENPEFFPMILYNGGSLNFERGEYMDSEAWMATVHAQPGSYYQLLEANYSYGNQLQYLDSTTGWWWSFLPKPFPESVEDTTVLVFDYSNPERYRYPLCGKLHYDDSTYVNINVTLKAPAGAPEKIAIVGDFISGWYSWEKGSLMTYKNGEYRVTVKATANSQFKFREYNGYSNYIEYTDGGAMENLVFGEFMDTANNVYVDLSNTARYRWVEWSDYIPKEIYSVTVQADNTENGSVTGGGEYKEGETAVIMAKPRMDCVFEGWSDGNQLNPRSVTVMSDTAFTAVFRRNIPIQPVEMFDTMYFTAADTTLIAVRVYAPSEIEPYDKLIIATVDNKNIMGFQALIAGNEQNYRSTVTYTPNMNIAPVSVVEVVPNGTYYRLRVEDGELAPRCEDCYQKLNQLYAVPVGADWYFAQYGKSVVPEAAAYANRMILYNKEAPRFSSYRQVTGLEREQTTVFKLNAKRVIPQEPTVVEEDLSALVEEENPMDEATVAMEVEPADTIAVISMPYVEFVHSFTLIVWSDEARTQVLMMITYDASGHVISVTKPNAVRRLMPREEGEVTFEIDDLEPETTYPYTLVACEDDGSILTSLNSSFTTTDGTEGIRNVFDHSSHTVKFLMNGQLFILRDGKLYNALGVQVKHL